MKVMKYLAVASLVSLAACNDRVTPDPELTPSAKGGNTFAGMYISAGKAAATRAINDLQEDYEGRPAESELISLDLISTGQNQSWEHADAEAVGKFWGTGQDGVYKVSPWKTNAGNQTMALVFNKGHINDLSIGTAAEHVYGDAADPSGDLQDLATDGHFVMTSKTEVKTIAEGVTEEKVKAGSAEADNVFTFNVERVVAQGLVAKGENLNQMTDDKKGMVDINNLVYAAVNGAVKTYFFANHAGERTLGVDGSYKDFKSAIDDYTDFENAKDANAVKEYLIRLGNVDKTGAYQVAGVGENVEAAKKVTGVYFLENSVKQDMFTPENKNFGFYRMAYAKIYISYTPNEVIELKDGKLQTRVGVADETFYKGEKDGLIYASKEAAKMSKVAPGQKAYTYTNGKCAYRALWNCQKDDAGKTVVNANVRRNNTYLLTIKSFQGLGMPWDSSDPSDPNLPKPTDPDEPTTSPDNPDIEKQDTYMKVEAKVLKWNLVSREVILD